MSTNPLNNHSQLSALWDALKAKEQDIKKHSTKEKLNDAMGDVEIALDLVKRADQQLSMESENRMETPLMAFDDDKAPVNGAFILLLDHLFVDSSSVRSACHTFFGLVEHSPNSVDFLSNDLTSKLTKNGAYTNWMTNGIRKGNKDALKTWNVLIRMMGKAINQPGPGLQVMYSCLCHTTKIEGN